jgi:wyosine [tRNA(Phe)-imidazoG37] synthetase (radical SAM superfamily)
MRSIYGPVPSRRLGLSLGIDLIPYKICSFDCIYCQLGRTTKKTIERDEYFPKDSILKELKDWNGEADYITFSGSGEPTLNSRIGEMIEEVKQMKDIPIAVLTNSSLFFKEEVREELKYADLIVPSLDAVTKETFERINRPHKEITVEKIIDGLKKFRKIFDGEIWVEVMLVKGINDGLKEMERMADVIEDINVERIQLNTVIRPPCEDVNPLNEDGMMEICKILGEKTEIISKFDIKRSKTYKKGIEDEIIELLRRRPCTMDDISNSLGIHRNEVVKYVEALKSKIKMKNHGDKRYFEVQK